MSLDAIGIVSSDITRSLRFYEILGLKLETSGESEHYEATTPSGLRLLVDSEKMIRSFEPDFKKVRGTGISLCFKQDSAEKVNQLYAQLVGEGFQSQKAPWDAFWGQRYACVLDPDGNQIDLFA